MNRLAGQVAWISGGASGIGAATAELFATEGAAVCIADVQQELGQELASRLSSQGSAILFSRCDVSQSDQVEQSIEETVTRFGKLNIVVNCAGIVHVGLLHDYDEADWDQLMGVNVKGIYLSLKHALKYLQANSESYMVNVASISSFIGQRATPAYTTSKGAVLSLTQSIALDYAATGLRCNCVCPGITDTPMLRKHLNSTPHPDETLRHRVRRVPIDRAMRSAEIAKSILYLSCVDSSGVTGTSLVVDGGYLAAAEWDTSDDHPSRGKNS